MTGHSTPSGILIINKPTTWTSFDVVAKVRRLFNIKKVGHAGTLDPMATGVLIILVGKATKLSDKLLTQDKQYTAEVTFGQQTDTGDADGTITNNQPATNINRETIQEVLPGLTGERDQMVPAYAAVKVKGKKLYQLARSGQAPAERPVRRIIIHRLELNDFKPHPKYPSATLTIHCSKGTYIRVLAEELAARLNTFAHLTALQRTASGSFTLDQAVSLEELINSQDPAVYLHQIN